MRFEPIPPQCFAEFHRSFHGDTEETFPVCRACGGACEFNKIGTLMPGEREFMAEVEGLSVEEFSEKYLDVLVMENGLELDVLRLINGCPFLEWHNNCSCGCRNYKVILCDIYPIGFHVQKGVVNFYLDEWCPIADTLRFRSHFLEVVPELIKLQVPVKWYEYVALYDDLYFDYVALENYRKDRSKLQAFTLKELLCFQRSDSEHDPHDPKERFHPYPSEVVSNLKPSIDLVQIGGMGK